MNREKIKKFFAGKTVRTVLLLLLALLLFLAVMHVFFPKKSASEYQATEREQKLSLILSEIEGVGKTRVMIGEEDGVAVSAVIVFEGADTLLTRMRVAEVAANVLSVRMEKIAVYPAA